MCGHLELPIKEEAPVAAGGMQQHPRVTLLLHQLRPMENPRLRQALQAWHVRCYDLIMKVD